jgi:NAD-dependent dihydropyrimidine dehydrogenase PreA subunit
MKYLVVALALIITLATQVVGSPFNCEINPKSYSKDFVEEENPFHEDRMAYGFNDKKRVEGASCSSMCPDINAIYDNCFVNKMQGMSKVATLSVRRSCERIACNPTFFQKLRYK